jgi:hypothetical protein
MDEKLDNWVELVNERLLEREFDLMCPVVGDEGLGKSTLILQLLGLHRQYRDLGIEPEQMFDRLVWGGRQEFKEMAVESERRAAICVPDAARVLYKRDAMDPEQREVEKDLLDIRTHEYLFLLGFQWWKDIPTMLQERRAKQLLRIPQRGVVEGYNREALDEKLEMDNKEWPDPTMRARFPSLEGTKIWQEYKQKDRRMKKERVAASDFDEDDEDDVDEIDHREIAEEIIAEGVGSVVSIHGGNKQPYIEQKLIEMNYGLGPSDAKKVKLVLEQRTGDLTKYTEEA